MSIGIAWGKINFDRVSFAFFRRGCYICNMPNKNIHIEPYEESDKSTFVPDDLYRRRVSLFAHLDVCRGDIVMLGDSLINCCEWHELLGDVRIKNRGINGDTVEGVYRRAASIMKASPAKVFLMVGINDVSHNIAPGDIARAIVSLSDYLHRLSPATRIYVHTLLPFDASYHYALLAGKEQDVCVINRLLKESASEHDYTLVELYDHFVEPSAGVLDEAYTTDGLHLTGCGYALWAQLLQTYLAE